MLTFGIVESKKGRAVNLLKDKPSKDVKMREQMEKMPEYQDLRHVVE